MLALGVVPAALLAISAWSSRTALGLSDLILALSFFSAILLIILPVFVNVFVESFDIHSSVHRASHASTLLPTDVDSMHCNTVSMLASLKSVFKSCPLIHAGSSSP